MKKVFENLSKNEKSLLLFLETQSVDYGGAVDCRHMNKIDLDIATKWNKEKFIGFGRVAAKDLNTHSTHCRTHWVTFSAEAFEFAHQERRERAKRMWENRTWNTTKEMQ